MAVERRNPLPIGSYLWAVFGTKMPAQQAWIDAHKDVVHVQQEGRIVGSGSDYGYWYYFHTSSPVAWEGPGLPDIATPELLAEHQALPTENPYITAAKKTVDDIREATKSGVGKVVLLAGLGFIGYKLLTRDR